MTHTLVQQIMAEDSALHSMLVPDGLLDSVANLIEEFGGCPPSDWPRALEKALSPILNAEEKEDLPAGVFVLEGAGFCLIPSGCVISRIFQIFHE